MFNCTMEVNDSIGFRSCCWEITLTNIEIIHQACRSLAWACVEERYAVSCIFISSSITHFKADIQASSKAFRVKDKKEA